VELNTRFAAGDNVELYADVSYNDAHYTSFLNGPCTVAQSLVSNPCVQDLSGKPRPYAPKWSGTVGANLSVPIGSNVLTFDPSVSFTSRYQQQANNDPFFEQEGYAKLDARLGFGATDRRWEIALIGKNLTDKITASVRNNVATTPGSTWALAEMGRSIAVQVSLKH